MEGDQCRKTKRCTPQLLSGESAAPIPVKGFRGAVDSPGRRVSAASDLFLSEITESAPWLLFSSFCSVSVAFV